jgi:hypothetical protein
MSRESVKSIIIVFGAAFALNYVWEHLHAVLYLHYKSGSITEGVLLHATLADALFLAGFSLPFLFVPWLKQRVWLIIPLGVTLALGIEWWALESARWAYADTMPVIPILGTGLTPTVQLGLTGYAAFIFANIGKKSA